MNLGSNRNAAPRKARLGPPPNYSSRAMKMRLFICAALLMFVVGAAMEARNPDRWKWLWSNDERYTEEKIDPRIRITSTDLNSISSDAPATKIGSEEAEEEIKEEGISTGDRAWAEGWKEIFLSLETKEKTQVYDLLRHAREQKTLAMSEVESVHPLIEKLTKAWLDYRMSAMEAVKRLGDQERAVWIPVLQQVELRWSVETQPALNALANGESLNEGQREKLAALQELLDRHLLRAVQDNTVWRSSETEIWFRLIGKLRSEATAEPAEQSIGIVPYAKLFKESKSYRGKMVTIEGRVATVYRVEAHSNIYGVQEYWVYWINPVGNSNSPIVVYALRKPDRFPSQPYEEVGHKPLPTHEFVTFHGYFFKKLAYQGKGGLFTAPTLVADLPIWHEEIPDPQKQLPSPLTALLVGSGIALLAAAFAYTIYAQYRPGSDRVLVDRISLPVADPASDSPMPPGDGPHELDPR